MPDTARDLLSEASRVLELLPPGESGDLLARIAGFLGEPIHVGNVITVKSGPVEESWNAGHYDRETHEFIPNPEVPDGLKVTAHDDTYEDRDGNEKPFTYHTYVWPEAGEARYLSSEDYDGGFVVTINGRRYRVSVHLDGGGWEAGGSPGGAVVTFTRTEEAETEFQSWNHEEALAKYRENRVRALESSKAELAKEPESEWAKYIRDDIDRCEKDIARCDSGDVRLNHPFYCQVFGQPNFIQNEMFPMHKGRMGALLCSIETGWGESGNVNILFACDDDGVPARVWFEASCC